MESIVAFSERHRGVVLAVTLGFALVGAVVASRLDLDALPDVTTNQVLVLATAPGFTPEEVEQRVTRPIETALGGIPGLEAQRSISRYGITAITAVFGDDVDPFYARQMVSERLTGVSSSLPAGVDPPELGPYTGGLGEIFHFTLRSDRRTPAELLELVRLRVAPLMRSIPGVVEINSWGGARRTLDVIADPVRMASLGVELTELQAAVEAASASQPGDSIPSGTGRTLLRAVSWPHGPADLGAVVVRGDSHSGRAIRVADVATIREGQMPRLGSATQDGRGEVVYVMAQMVRGGNARDVTAAIRDHLPEVRRALPDDVRLEVIYDRSELVDRTLHTVGKSLAEGGFLVALVLLTLLGSLRAGLVVASTIPLAMIGAAAGMVALGIPGNLMSLGAIDFGLVVDGGVVMVESVFHHLQRNDVGEDRRTLARDAMTSMARPVFFSVLIIALVYVPILTLTGVDGKMFRPMAATVVFALLVSLVLSLTYVPAAASLVVDRGNVTAHEPKLVAWTARIHGKLLDLAMPHPKVVALVSVAAFALAAVALSRAGTEFVPQLDEGGLIIQTTRAPDIRLETAVNEALTLERALHEHVPEVVRVVSRLGSPAVATDIMGIEQGDVVVVLKPREQWRDGMTKDQLVERIEAVLREHAPHGDRDYTQPIQMRFNELLGGSVSDVSVTVYGDDLTTLRRIGEQTAASLERVHGVSDVRISAPPAVDLVEVRPTSLHASHVGLRPRDVVNAVSALRFGLLVGETYDGSIRIPIRLRIAGASTVYDLPNAPIPVQGGQVVPLSVLAELVHLRAPGAVEHTDGQRRITIGFNVRGADLGSTVASVQGRLEREVQLPLGFRRVYGGQFENMRAAYGRLAIVVPIVLVIIVAVLAWMFHSVRTALVVFTNVPFATVGGAFALALRGMPVSVSAIIGFIALSGIAVLNGVVLMNRMITLEAEEGMSPALASRRAAEERMRPVLMTASVAALGFVPMMLAQGVGAEVQRPLATVVVGGLLTSTVLTLLVLPSLRAFLTRKAVAS